MKKVSLASALNYGSIGICLGFISLPLYVYLPKYYAETYQVSLVLLSVVILCTRLIDTVQDPIIGWLSDKLLEYKISRLHIITIAIPLLCLSFLGLLFPPEFGGRILWITVFLVLTYTLFSFVSVNYYTTATEITEEYNQQTKLVSARETLSLTGISIGAIIPSFLQQKFSATVANSLTWLLFVTICCCALYVFAYKSPAPEKQKTTQEKIFVALKIVSANRMYLLLALVFLLSTTAAALPATIVLFYIKDVIQAEPYYGLFLGLYFLCAIIGLPLWYILSSILGKKNTWLLAMLITICSFIWATFLGPGDLFSYGLICVLTGLCLGADLVMPASMLSDLIANSPNKAKYFGVWGMVGKSSLAFAGSASLFILGSLGYTANTPVDDTIRLYISLSYALFPCLIKLISFILLYKIKIDLIYKK